MAEDGRSVTVGTHRNKRVAIGDDGRIADISALEERGETPLEPIVMGEPWKCGDLGTGGSRVVAVGARYKATPEAVAEKSEVARRGQSPLGKIATGLLADAVGYFEKNPSRN